MKVQTERQERIRIRLDDHARELLQETAFRAQEFCWKYVIDPPSIHPVHLVGPWHDWDGIPLPAHGPHMELRRLIEGVSNAVANLERYAESQGWRRQR